MTGPRLPPGLLRVERVFELSTLTGFEPLHMCMVIGSYSPGFSSIPTLPALMSSHRLKRETASRFSRLRDEVVKVAMVNLRPSATGWIRRLCGSRDGGSRSTVFGAFGSPPGVDTGEPQEVRPCNLNCQQLIKSDRICRCPYQVSNMSFSGM